jgi:hypothetical protein
MKRLTEKVAAHAALSRQSATNATAARVDEHLKMMGEVWK